MTVSNIHDSNAKLIVSNGRLVSLLMQLIKLVVHKIPHQVGIPASYAREKRRKSMYPLDRIHGGGSLITPPSALTTSAMITMGEKVFQMLRFGLKSQTSRGGGHLGSPVSFVAISSGSFCY